MSIDLMRAVTKYGPSNSSQRFVLLMIADNAADDGSNSFPKIETLAKKTALSDRTVIRAIDALVKDGYLIRRRRKDTSNIYQIVLSKLQNPVSDKLSHTVSDKLSLTQVTQSHLGTCHDVTYEGDTVSHDPSLINHPINHPDQGESASAKNPPPVTVKFNRNDTSPGPKGKGYKLPSEPPVSPPAAQLMQRLTGFYPGANNVGYIAERLGDSPDEKVLAYVVKEWGARGFKMSNYAGICDWYDQRKANPKWTPPRNGQTAAPEVKPKSTQGYAY